MNSFRLTGTTLFSPARLQWAPTLTAHDPNPPITLEGSQNTVSPGSINSEEAFGTPTVINQQFITPTGIASAEAFGTPLVSSGGVFIIVTGIPSEEAFGTPTLVLEGIIEPTGIASEEAFGTPIIVQNQTVTVTGIASGEAFGIPTVTAVVPPIPPPPVLPPGKYGVLGPLGEDTCCDRVPTRGQKSCVRRGSGMISVGTMGAAGSNSGIGTKGG